MSLWRKLVWSTCSPNPFQSLLGNQPLGPDCGWHELKREIKNPKPQNNPTMKYIYCGCQVLSKNFPGPWLCSSESLILANAGILLQNPQRILGEFEGFVARKFQHKPQSNSKKLNELEADCVVSPVCLHVM